MRMILRVFCVTFFSILTGIIFFLVALSFSNTFKKHIETYMLDTLRVGLACDFDAHLKSYSLVRGTCTFVNLKASRKKFDMRCYHALPSNLRLGQILDQMVNIRSDLHKTTYELIPELIYDFAQKKAEQQPDWSWSAERATLSCSLFDFLRSRVLSVDAFFDGFKSQSFLDTKTGDVALFLMLMTGQLCQQAVSQ